MPYAMSYAMPFAVRHEPSCYALCDVRYRNSAMFYAVSSTCIAQYCPTRSLLLCWAISGRKKSYRSRSPLRSPKRSPVRLPAYAPAGTDLAYGLRACYAVSGTDLSHQNTAAVATGRKKLPTLESEVSKKALSTLESEVRCYARATRCPVLT
eukprot:129683-Rhodomonas_salina.2